MPCASPSFIDQRVAQQVVPAPRRGGQAGFELAAVVGRHLAGVGADGEVHARQHGVAERTSKSARSAGERLHQDAWNFMRRSVE